MKFIQEAAERMRSGGWTVDMTNMPTVSIWHSVLKIGAFMQGDEASDFQDQVEALCEKFPDLNKADAELALAEPYTE